MTKISTLYDGLLPFAVDARTVEKRYPAMISLAREVLGVYANCYSLLELWPVGFRTYNLLIPNFTNIPFSLLGFGPPKDLLGLAMYKSSKAAGCGYCTAHSCTFALRRGARTDDIVGEGSAQAKAVSRFAEGLSQIPASLGPQEREEVLRFVSESDLEWLALGVAMMGFLNKFMDSMGIALESGIISDVGGLLPETGWEPGKHWAGPITDAGDRPPVDNLGIYLRILRKAPAAIRQEAGWTRGVPSTWPEAGEYLKTQSGYEFPVLAALTHKRAIRATTTILRDNLDAQTSACGLAVKPLAAFVFATVIGDEDLQRVSRRLAECHSGEFDDFEALAEFANLSDPASTRLNFLTERTRLTAKQAVCLLLAQEAAPSPVTLAPDLVEAIVEGLAPEEIIEMMVWLSVVQMLHRLGVYASVNAQQ